MLKLVIPAREFFNSETSEFIKIPEIRLELQHSLVSLSKWESIWEKPFLSKGEKTTEETYSYIQCMSMNDISEKELQYLPNDAINAINNYISAKASATWFSDRQSASSSIGEQITTELIYYWMIALSIPLECENWHLNRLFTLIKICNEKNKPPTKMSRAQIIARQRQLNAERKAKYNTSG